MFKERGTLPLDKIIPYERNPRVNDEAVPMLYNSIRDFGYISEITVNQDGVILSGHTRLKALQRLYEDGEFEKGRLKEQGLTADAIPVKIVHFDNPDEENMYRLADNKTGEKAGWDFDLLDDIIDGLKDSFDPADYGFDFDLWGDDDGVVEEDEVMGKVPSEHPDKLPSEPEGVPVSFPDVEVVEDGDVIHLGEHVLVCSRLTKEAVAKHAVGDYTVLATTGTWPSGIVRDCIKGSAIVRVGDFDDEAKRVWLKVFLSDPVYDFIHWSHPVMEDEGAGFIRHAFDTFILIGDGMDVHAPVSNGGFCEEPLLADAYLWAIEGCTSDGDLILDLTCGERDIIDICESIGRRCVSFCDFPSVCDCIVSKYVEKHGLEGCMIERGGKEIILSSLIG